MKLRSAPAIAVFLTALSAFASTPAAQAPTANPLDTILHDLASDDFPTRSAAQKSLDQIPPARRDELQHLADTTSDPEVRARLLARAGTMEEESILNFPPINLDLKAASLADTCAALSQALNFPIMSGSLGNAKTNPLTVNLKNASFGQVMQQLFAQAPLTYGSVAGFEISQNPRPAPADFAPPQGSGSLVFLFPKGTLDNKTIHYGTVLIADPRLQTIESGNVISWSLTATDDMGNRLQGLEFKQIRPDFKSNYFSTEIALTAPENPKAKITLKGEVGVRIVTQYTRATINDPEKHVGESQNVGGVTISVRTFIIDPNRFSVLEIKVAGLPPLDKSVRAEATQESGSAIGSRLRIVLLDAANRQIVNYFGGAINIPQNVMDAAKKPFRLEVAVPLQWKTIKFPVELKGLPVPQAPPAGG